MRRSSARRIEPLAQVERLALSPVAPLAVRSRSGPFFCLPLAAAFLVRRSACVSGPPFRSPLRLPLALRPDPESLSVGDELY
ncbi:MAG: hypothetical protein ACE5NC_05235, partial [Anaerolineae bacterium]